MWYLTIYDTREDWQCDTGYRSYHETEDAAHIFMRGYGKYFDYEVERISK